MCTHLVSMWSYFFVHRGHLIPIQSTKCQNNHIHFLCTEKELWYNRFFSHYCWCIISNQMLLCCQAVCNVVWASRGSIAPKIKWQEPFIAWLCETSVSLWPLIYADLTIMLAASHGLPYASHRVRDTDTGHSYAGISQSLWAQLRGEVLWTKWQHYTNVTCQLRCFQCAKIGLDILSISIQNKMLIERTLSFCAVVIWLVQNKMATVSCSGYITRQWAVKCVAACWQESGHGCIIRPGQPYNTSIGPTHILHADEKARGVAQYSCPNIF